MILGPPQWWGAGPLGIVAPWKKGGVIFLYLQVWYKNSALNTSDLEITRLKAYEVTVRLRKSIAYRRITCHLGGAVLIRSEIKIAMSPVARVCTWNSINYVWAVPGITRYDWPQHIPKYMWHYKRRFFFRQNIVRRDIYCEEGVYIYFKQKLYEFSSQSEMCVYIYICKCIKAWG